MMRKYLIILVAVWLNAGLLNAIAVVVNGIAITMYDIDKTANANNLSQKQAIKKLIDDILYKQELEKFNLVVSNTELLDYIKMLALSNKMSIEKFKSTIKQNQNYDTFINNIKKRILNRKLISKIAIGKLKMATDEDMKIYYENNIQQFKKNKNSIQVVPFKEVKNKIFNIIMSQREQKYLKEYFKKLKLKADIKIIRQN
jgi:hypothetical protein